MRPLASTICRRALGPLAVALLLLGVTAGCGGGEQNDAQQEQPPPLPSGELAVEDPWVRPASSGGTSALYMTLANGLDTADTLLSVRAPIVGSSEVHASSDSAGTASMTPIGPLPVPSKTRVTLAPGSTHVMLMDLGQPLRQGESVVLSLDFAEAGLRRIRAPIQAQPPSDGDPSM
jgi:hypothetical protein